MCVVRAARRGIVNSNRGPRPRESLVSVNQSVLVARLKAESFVWSYLSVSQFFISSVNVEFRRDLQLQLLL